MAGSEHGGGEEHAAHHHDTTAQDIVLFLFMMCAIGQFFKYLAAWTGIPYTSLITVLGLFFGIYHKSLGRLGPAIQAYAKIDAHLILLLFLPALIFESAFNSDWHIFKVEFGQILLMAGPMLLVSTLLSALMMRYIMGYDDLHRDDEQFTWSAALMYGSIISATDPVAVVALLKELGASRRLATLIEGESLLNDGTAMVVFLVIIDIVKGAPFEAGGVIVKFIRLSVGGPILGVIGGMVMSAILKRINNNYILEVNTTIFVSYLIFFVAESTPVHVSGILAVVFMGLYMTNVGKTRISAKSEHAVHHVWGYLGFVAETVIFILSGIIMGERAVQDGNLITYIDYLKLLAIYVILHIIRFGIIFAFWPCLRRMGYGLTFKEVVLCSYAGLRGAVGMSLALMVAADPEVPEYIQDIVLLHVAGIALLTLIINATTTGALVRYLGLSKQSDIKKSILAKISTEMDKEDQKSIDKTLNGKKHFNQVQWDKLKEDVELTQLKEKLQQFKQIDISGVKEKVKHERFNDGLSRATTFKGGDGGTPTEHHGSSFDDGPAPKARQFGGGSPMKEGEESSEEYEEDPSSSSDSAGNKKKRVRFDKNQGHGKKKYKPRGRVDRLEFIREIRYKYLTILKSQYWEQFEEGQCSPEAVTILRESADRALDHDEAPVEDWDFINTWVVGTKYIECLGILSKLPLIGRIFKSYLYDHFSTSYDICINFVAAHEESYDKISQIFEDAEEYLQIIHKESLIQIEGAEQYMMNKIEKEYPEISRAVQQRRAMYFLLIHKWNFIEHELHTGKIEQKDADELCDEVKKKIHYLQLNPPEISLDDQKSQIINNSVLSQVFSREELEKAFRTYNHDEQECYPGNHIIVGGDRFEYILYVARGMIIEKNGPLLDPAIPQLKHVRGDIACLHNIIPGSEHTDQIADIYCNNSSVASVEQLNLTYLKAILKHDIKRLEKLWLVLAPRMIILHHDKLTQFQGLTQDKIQRFCRLCLFKIYQPSDEIDLSEGGILLRGGLSRMDEDHDEIQQNLNKHDIFVDQDLKSSLEKSDINALALDIKNLGKLAKKKGIKNLGDVIKKVGVQNLDKGEFFGIQFVKPRPKGGEARYVAKSRDNVVIMHFSALTSHYFLKRGINAESMRGVIREMDIIKKRGAESNLMDRFEFLNSKSGRETMKAASVSRSADLLAMDMKGLSKQKSREIKEFENRNATSSAPKPNKQNSTLKNALAKSQTLKVHDVVLEMNPMDESSSVSKKKIDALIEQTEPKVASGTGGMVTLPDKNPTQEDGDSMNLDTVENEAQVNNVFKTNE